MAADEIRMNDIGTVLVSTIKDSTSVIDISLATVKSIILGKPDSTTLTKSGTFTTDGTDGKLQYTTVSGDLNQCGWWKIQALITDSSGTWRSDIGNFEVHKNII